MKLQDDAGLLRELGLVGAIAIGLGAVIGAGIFVVTGVAAGLAGPAFILGLALAGIAAVCNGLSSAQLAAQYPYAGGTYEYGYRVLHPSLGFAAGWMFMVSKLAAGSVVAIGFGSYLQMLVPAIPAKGASVAAILILTLANIFGIKKVGFFNILIVSFTLLVLTYFILSGLPVMESDNFIPFAPAGIPGIAEASALLFFAYTGYARIATLGAEVKHPEKNIPLAIMITLLISFLIYAGVSLVAVGTAGIKVIGFHDSPLQAAAEIIAAPGLPILIIMGAATAMFGVLLSQILGISRMMYAMAGRRDLPAMLGKTNKSYSVPVWGVIASGAIILLITLTGTLYYVVSAASFSILLYYGIANLSALRMPAEKKMFHDYIPLSGFIFCLLMAFSINWQVILSGTGILLTGFLFRWLMKKFYP